MHVRCHLCGHSHSSCFIAFPRYSILSCLACGLRFLWPQPDTGAINALYSNEYFASDDSVSPGYSDYVAQASYHRATFQGRLKLLPPPAQGAQLVDAGAAAGFFVEQAKLAGWNARGVEPNDTMARYARDVLGVDVRSGTLEELRLPPGGIDAVTLWEVIEHLPNPRAFLVEAKRILRPGGILALSTPDAGSIVSRMSGRRWLGWRKVPEHLFFFSKPTLTRLLNECGFELTRTRYVSITVPLGFACARLTDLTGIPLDWLPKRVTSYSVAVNPLYDLFVLARAR